MPVTEVARGIRHAAGEYDFAVDGGAISTIVMRSSPADPLGNDIPNNAVILGGYIEVDTLLTSGGAASVGINSEAVGDILATALISGAPWSTTGRKSIIPVFTGVTTVKTSARRTLAVAITAATVTAGKFRVVLVYMAGTP
jgi:phage-related tail protein